MKNNHHSMLPIRAFKRRGSVLGGSMALFEDNDYSEDPRYAASQGRFVGSGDAGGTFQALDVATPLGRYVGQGGDSGDTYQEYTSEERAQIASQNEADRQYRYQAAQAAMGNSPLSVNNNQIQTQYGDRDVSLFNPLAQAGSPVTGDTRTQLYSNGMPVFLSDPNNPTSFTTSDTGIPALGGTVAQEAMMYREAPQNGVFGTIGGDFRNAAKDPYFHKFLAAAAAMATAGATLPLDSLAAAGTTGAADFGSFIAADALASTAGEGAFSLAASLGMPLDQAVTAGFINGAGALTDLGAATLLGSAGAPISSSTAGGFLGGAGDILAGAAGTGGGALGASSGLTLSQILQGAKLASTAARALSGAGGSSGGANPYGMPTSIGGGGGGGGALPGNLQATVLQGSNTQQYDPFASYSNLPQLSPIQAAEGGNVSELAQLQQQIGAIDPRLMSVIQKRTAPSYFTYGKDSGGLPTQFMNDRMGARPTPGYQSQSSSLTKEPMFENYGLKMPSLDNRESNYKGYRDGGDVHIPEFITGATGHYVRGRGDGQSDEIPAMLADGEFVFDSSTVSTLGNGSSDAGAKLLDAFRESLREHTRSAPKDKIPPKASPLEYMKEAMRRVQGGKV